MSVVTATILSEGKAIDPGYEVLSIDVMKELNRIPYAQLVVLDGDAALQTFEISDTDFFEPGKAIEIKLGYLDDPSSEATVFKGLVIRHSVEADEAGTRLTIEMKDEAFKLTTARKSAVFTKMTDADVIGKIIKDNGLKKGTVTATKTTHAGLVQYYCTDWDFIVSRADVLGLPVVVDDGEISLPELKVSGKAKHTFEFGLSEIFNFEMEADASHQVANVMSVAWDVKKQKLTKELKAKAFKLQQGDLDGAKIAKAIGATDYTLVSPTPMDSKELQAWSDAKMAKDRMSLLRGRLSVPGLAKIKPMDVMEIKGVGKRFNGTTLVTGLRHRVDLDGWRTDVQFGLSAPWFSKKDDIVDRPAAGLLPGVNGLQIGKVSAFEEDPYNEYRVPVILPGIDETTEGLLWARLAAPDAGLERGWFFRPEVDDEVVVGFINDDPRQPVILGALYSSAHAPPSAMIVEENNLTKGIVTKAGTTLGFIDDDEAAVFIETPRGRKILLDDKQEMVQLKDEHGNEITLSKDGIVIKSAKDFIVEASENVKIKGTKVDVK